MIIEEFGSLDHPEIARTALAVTRIVDETNSGNWVVDLETGFCYSTGAYLNLSDYGFQKSQLIDCALDALGIPAALIGRFG